jgi:YVTN family beta-propeller protein
MALGSMSPAMLSMWRNPGTRCVPLLAALAVVSMLVGPVGIGPTSDFGFDAGKSGPPSAGPAQVAYTRPAFHPAPSWPGWNPASGRPSPNLGNDTATTVSLSTSLCSTSYPPWAWLAFDSLDGSFWAAAPYSCVDVITGNGSNGATVVASYPVGIDPFGVAIDTSTGNVYVTNTGSNNVTVLNGTTGASVANITVGLSPYGVAYDPSTQNIYVANGGSDNLSVISGTSEKVVTSVGVGSTPVGVAVDPSNGQLFVANNGSANVSVLSLSNNTVVASVDVGQNPYGIAIDNLTNQAYVTNRGSDTVSVIDASNDTVAVTIGIGQPLSPEGVAYNPVNELVWVGAVFYTVLINTTSQTVLGYLATDPSGVAVDPTSGVVCVTNTANATLRCLSYPNLIFPSDDLHFVESGLPTTANWSVTLYWPGYYRSTHETNVQNGEIVFNVFHGSPSNYSYMIPPTDGYFPTTPSATISISSETTVQVSFVPRSETYTVTFAESGLSPRTPWNVTLSGLVNGSTMGLITFQEPNGTYAFSVSPPAGFAANPVAGTVIVNGSNLSRTIVFGPAPVFPVRFNESGLPLGSRWYVEFNGVWASNTTPTIQLASSNGTFDFQIGPIVGFVASPGSGFVKVSGVAQTVQVAFEVPTTYVVTFDESGLRSGTLWSVDLNGSNEAATSPRVQFNISNGAYSFSVVLPLGYTASPANGSISVRGNNVSRSILFSVTSNPLSANLTYQIEYASCLSSGGVTNYVLLAAEVSGGTAPFSYAWVLPTGTATGALADTTATYGQNLSVTLTVLDAAHDSASKSAQLGMELPPCPPPARNVSPTLSAASLSLDEWAIIGLTAGLVTAVGIAVWLGLRGRGGSSIAS